MNNIHPEILAPAGSRESLSAAIAAGADAVYMGGSRFGARAYAENPDEDGLLEAIDEVHLHGRRLYMTVNTLMKEKELERDLIPWFTPYYRQGVDAVLVQDPGVLFLLKEAFPKQEIHISTQMAIASPWGARLVKEWGASRLVLPRELSLTEISAIREACGLEIETFVHGALCYCYSGQCLLSSLIGGRSGNRGRCAQPCRLPYNGEHLLNLKDLCTLDILPDILEAGVSSLKIEGRMKGPRYTAGTVAVYKKYVDQYLEHGREGYRVDPEDKELLRMLFDRGGSTEGYYRRHNGADMIYPGEKPKQRAMDEERLRKIDRMYTEKKRQEPVTGELTAAPGEPLRLSLSCREHSVTVPGPVVQEAKNRPLTAAELSDRIKKTGDTSFIFEDLKVQVSGDIFLPVGAINAFRREALRKLEEEIIHAYRR